MQRVLCINWMSILFSKVDPAEFVTQMLVTQGIRIVQIKKRAQKTRS